MHVCHCNVITDRDIEDVVRRMLDEDPWQLIVPAKVYHAMDKRGRCCSCFPNVVDIIVRVTEEYHQQSEQTDLVRLSDVRAHLSSLRRRHPLLRSTTNERRSAGHRAA
jgi:bacterioferritin-associated ferredoxin